MRPSLHRHTLAALLALASLLLAPAGASAETYWLDGYELDFTLKPVRPSFVVGETVELWLTFENRSEAAVELLLSGPGGRGWPDDFEVRVTGPDGRALTRPEGAEKDSFANIFVSARQNEQKGTPSTLLKVSLGNWAKVERPGVYKVSLRRGVVAGPYDGRQRLSPETTKPRTELRLETEFTVAEGGESVVGALVEELGAKTLACDQSPAGASAAAKRLAALEDERAVRPLAAADAKCKEPGVRYPAILALAKFPTDAAFEALRSASADADEDFRAAAAQTLARNKHPKSAALLLSMRGDAFYGVRLIVLHALKGVGTEDARRLIWEMTNDAHPAVRNSALVFLQQNPAPPR